MKRIAFFASGSGSNVENIVSYFKDSSSFEFPIIISNRKNAYVHERALRLNIPSVSFKKEDFRSGEEIVKLLREERIDAIVLAGFLLKVPNAIIQAYPNMIINIHPALLPKFGGKGMYGDNVHRSVKEAGETETGITIHYINDEYDEGDIIFQASCPVTSDDTAESIAEKVHQLEYEHFPKIIEKLWGISKY